MNPAMPYVILLKGPKGSNPCAVRVMEVPVGSCENVASVAVTIVVVIAVVCSDVAGITVLFMTESW